MTALGPNSIVKIEMGFVSMSAQDYTGKRWHFILRYDISKKLGSQWAGIEYAAVLAKYSGNYVLYIYFVALCATHIHRSVVFEDVASKRICISKDGHFLVDAKSFVSAMTFHENENFVGVFNSYYNVNMQGLSTIIFFDHSLCQ
jgi:hypothetical protein